jgi:ribosomal protein L37E
MLAKQISCPACGYFRTRRIRDLSRLRLVPRNFVDLAFWPFRLPLRGRYSKVSAGDNLKCIHCGYSWVHAG